MGTITKTRILREEGEDERRTKPVEIRIKEYYLYCDACGFFGLDYMDENDKYHDPKVSFGEKLQKIGRLVFLGSIVLLFGGYIVSITISEFDLLNLFVPVIAISFLSTFLWYFGRELISDGKSKEREALILREKPKRVACINCNQEYPSLDALSRENTHNLMTRDIDARIVQGAKILIYKTEEFDRN